MAIRWLEAHVKENNRKEAPTKEQLEELDCLKDSDGSEENMDQKTTDAMVQSQHDCLVERLCQEACVENCIEIRPRLSELYRL